ncbi:hypothetical protein [Flavobacterium agrisoli]|uniref:Uncharacterized protein n=1 Tax=Flavobacterium agrisoli TaxID=2793066 RepID=A0A934PKQ9_9FLAO|nr:hypothetical protein [Flavobacterium agrisoli]MBK0369956.1 hypothetical protein [Flavobacterium agrisoli]
MYLIHTKYLIPKGYRGLTLYPFVLIKYKQDKTNAIFINHEKIHLRQQLEMLIVPFFIWYILEFVWRWMKFRNFHLGYRNISFEKEAYYNETDFDYLKKRKFFQFTEYI